MKVHEFVKWLEQFPDQDATVEIIVHEYGRGYYNQGDNVHVEEFDPNNTDHYEYSDMRNNKFAVGKPYQDSHTLLIGSRE